MRKQIWVALIAAVALGLPAVLQASAQTAPSASPSPSATPLPGSTPRASVPLQGHTITSGGTVIHPGDQLNVQVFGDQTLTQATMVLADGTVDYPLIGRVKVAGKTPDQAASTLASHMHEYVRHPVVTVAITQLGLPNVLVLGDVKTPGKYQLRSDAKLTDAIAAAGGLATVNGDFPDARIADADGNVSQVSLQKLLQGGDATLDERLGEGSVVYVPGPVVFTVDITGAVDHPGDIQVNEGDHLSVAIAKAGNSQNAHSDLNHVRVIHTAPDGKQTTQEINLYDALKSGNQSVDVALQKGDVIYVPETYQHRTDFFSGLLYVLSRIIP